MNMYTNVLSAESVTVNPRTLELFVGLIRSHTKASKGPACPDIENEDLLSTSRMHRAQLTNPELRPLLKGDKPSFSMCGHVPL